MSYILLILGFALLLKGADYFVDGASSIASILKVPPLLIGLTIVSFGTSAPEASASISAALKGVNGIVVGNVIGSNVFNLLLAVGLAASITAISVQKTTIIKEFPLSIYSILLLIVLSLDIFIDRASVNIISRIDGLILLLGFGVFLFYLVEMAFLSKEAQEEISTIIKLPVPRSLLYTVGGLAAIIAGGSLVVQSAVSIALAWGMSQILTGLTIVAIGTSLPELITSVTAARKGENDIAMGNIIGSGLFNLLFVLGVSSLINPIEISTDLYIDLLLLLSVTIICYLFAFTHRKISRREGIFLVFIYVIYIVYVIIRN